MCGGFSLAERGVQGRCVLTPVHMGRLRRWLGRPLPALAGASGRSRPARARAHPGGRRVFTGSPWRGLSRGGIFGGARGCCPPKSSVPGSRTVTVSSRAVGSCPVRLPARPRVAAASRQLSAVPHEHVTRWPAATSPASRRPTRAVRTALLSVLPTGRARGARARVCVLLRGLSGRERRKSIV